MAATLAIPQEEEEEEPTNDVDAQEVVLVDEAPTAVRAAEPKPKVRLPPLRAIKRTENLWYTSVPML